MFLSLDVLWLLSCRMSAGSGAYHHHAQYMLAPQVSKITCAYQPYQLPHMRRDIPVHVFLHNVRSQDDGRFASRMYCVGGVQKHDK